MNTLTLVLGVISIVLFGVSMFTCGAATALWGLRDTMRRTMERAPVVDEILARHERALEKLLEIAGALRDDLGRSGILERRTKERAG